MFQIVADTITNSPNSFATEKKSRFLNFLSLYYATINQILHLKVPFYCTNELAPVKQPNSILPKESPHVNHLPPELHSRLTYLIEVEGEVAGHRAVESRFQVRGPLVPELVRAPFVMPTHAGHSGIQGLRGNGKSYSVLS